MKLELPLCAAAAWLATSVVLAIAQWLDRVPMADVLAHNATPPGTRKVVIVAVMLAALLAASATAWAQLRGRDVRRVLSLLSPLAIAFAIPALFVRELWRNDERMFLIYAGGVGLISERLLRTSLRVAFDHAAFNRIADRLRAIIKSPRLFAWSALSSIMLAYVVVIGRYTLINHWNLGTTSSDLAEFDNLFFNAAHGHPFRSPAIDADLHDWGAFKVHAELILYALLPLYAWQPKAETLLWIQTVAIALTCVPIYAFASRRLGRTAGVVFAALYLLMPAVQRPNFYDFHFTPIGMLFVASTLALHDAATDSRAMRIASYVTFVAALLSREDTAAGLGLAMLILAMFGARPRASATLGLIALGYVVTIKFFVMPLFGPSWLDSIYAQLRAPGMESMRGVFATLISNPVFALRAVMTEAKFLYALHLTVPLLALWLRRPWLLLAALPGALFTLFVTDRNAMSENTFQYTYLCVPYLVFASVLGVQYLTDNLSDLRGQRAAALLSALLVALACTWNQGALLGAAHVRGGASDKRLFTTAADRQAFAELQRVIDAIPQQASVAATEHEGPHVSNRLVMYSLKHSLGHQPDYLLLGDVRLRHERASVTEAVESGHYELATRIGRFRLLRRTPTRLTKLERKALLREALL